MRIENVPITLTIECPIDTPDKNGNIYTEQAVRRAISGIQPGLPMMCDDVQIGEVAAHPYGVCKSANTSAIRYNLACVLDVGGTSCKASVSKSKDGWAIIDEFTITSIGLSFNNNKGENIMTKNKYQ